MVGRFLAVGGTIVAVALVAPAARAIDNTVPSKAPVVSVGVPFTATEPNGKPDVWRLDQVVRTGDTVQLAVDNTQGSQSLNVCLLGPTDDFGYDNEVGAVGCGGLFDDSAADFVVSEGRSDRASATYIRSTGTPLIRMSSLFDRVNSYTATVESITTLINIGAVAPPTAIGRTFSFAATLRHGDNSPVGDGTAAALEWRKGRGAPGPTAFTRIASATSVGGQVLFQATLPPEAAKRVQLRACVTQAGASPNCTTTVTATVAPLVTEACRDARKASRRARLLTARLVVRLLGARKAAVRRRMARRLRVAKRQLRVAKRLATRQCVASGAGLGRP